MLGTMQRSMVLLLLLALAACAAKDDPKREGQVIRRSTTPTIDPKCEGCEWSGDESEGACKKGNDACETNCCIR